MKRALFCCFSLLLVLALAPTLTAETADVEQFLQFMENPEEPVNTAANCRCLQIVQQTAEYMGDQPTCSASLNQAQSAAYSEASGSCGVDGLCYQNFVVTMECTTNPANGWQWSKGYLEYRCLVCF